MARTTSDCRVYISLRPETYATVSELAQLLGKPRATLISDMVEEHADVLAQLTEAVRLAKGATEAAATVWRGDIAETADRAQKLAEEADKIINDLALKGGVGRPAQAAGTGARAHGAAVSGSSGPLAINKGARNLSTKTDKGAE